MKRTVFIILIFTILLFQGTALLCPEDLSPDVFIIPVNGDIDRPLTVFIRRGIDAAREAGAGHIVFEINTFGGRVDSALQIATLIGSAYAETVAYIPALPESTGVSWSAGALISFSCDRIFMAPGTSMGGGGTGLPGSRGDGTCGGKKPSARYGRRWPLSRKRNGYPKDAALAMVDSDIELVEVIINGQLMLTPEAELDQLRTDTEEAGGSFKKGRTVLRRRKTAYPYRQRDAQIRPELRNPEGSGGAVQPA